MSQRWSRRVLWAAVAATGVSLLPPVQARGKAIAVLAEAVGRPLPRPFAAQVERREVTLDGVTGDLYSPAGRAPGLVLLPGAAPRGRHDRRVVAVARSIARAGRQVFVPDLALAEQRFVPDDIDRVVRATVALSRRPEATGRASLLGFSYGGSYALVAAADRRLHSVLDQVATFGSYFDLVGVLQAATTGVSLVGNRRVPWRPDPRARDVVRDVAATLLPEPARPALLEAFAGRLPADRLPAGTRAVYNLVTNTDPARTYRLAERLPVESAIRLRALSPVTVAADIDVPVVAMHSSDDPLVPYGELARLEASLPHAATFRVRTFRHVDLSSGDGGALLRDVVTAWRFTSRLIGAQE